MRFSKPKTQIMVNIMNCRKKPDVREKDVRENSLTGSHLDGDSTVHRDKN